MVPGTTSTPHPWSVVEYEVKMYFATHEILFNPEAFGTLSRVLKNAVEESAVLHTRILAGVFLSKGSQKDDLRLANLFPNWATDSRYASLKQAVNDLSHLYGKSDLENTPCWIFNKMLAHPT